MKPCPLHARQCLRRVGISLLLYYGVLGARAAWQAEVVPRETVDAERQCEIIGEALAKLAKSDQPVAAQISEHRRIIAFRNILRPLYPFPVRHDLCST